MEIIEKRQQYRPVAREHAAVFAQQMAAAAAAGENIHQLGIDLNDQEIVFVASLPPEDRELYESLYAEELSACTRASNAKAAELELKTIETQAQNSQNSMVVVWAVLIALLLIIFLARLTS